MTPSDFLIPYVLSSVHSLQHMSKLISLLILITSNQSLFYKNLPILPSFHLHLLFPNLGCFFIHKPDNFNANFCHSVPQQLWRPSLYKIQSPWKFAFSFVNRLRNKHNISYPKRHCLFIMFRNYKQVSYYDVIDLWGYYFLYEFNSDSHFLALDKIKKFRSFREGNRLSV